MRLRYHSLFPNVANIDMTEQIAVIAVALGLLGRELAAVLGGLAVELGVLASEEIKPHTG